MKKILISLLAIILLISFSIGLFLFFKSHKELPKKVKIVEIRKEVKVIKVKYRTIETSITSSGRVLSKNNVILSSEVSGKILNGNVPFKKSQSFKKGDVLLRIYDKNAKNFLKAHKSSFLQLISNILPDISIDYSTSYKKWKMFFNNIDIDKPLPNFPKIDSEKEKIYLASRQVLSNYYNLKSEEITFSKYIIRAPFDGSYTQVMSEVGSIAGMGSPLAHMISTGDLEIEVPVDIDKSFHIKIGNRVKINTTNGISTYGTVIRKAKYVDEKTQSINTFIKFSNKNIFSGMYLTVEFTGIKINNVMQLSRSLIINKNKVWIVKDSTLQKNELNIVKTQINTLLFNGIEEGTNIIISPMVKPNFGEKVNITIFNTELESQEYIQSNSTKIDKK